MNAAQQPRAALTAARVEGFLAAAGDPVAVVREAATDLRVVHLVRSPIQRDDKDNSTLVVKLVTALTGVTEHHRHFSVPFCLRLICD